MLNDQDIERILVITAHPDDLDFGAGGTIASWAAQGIEVSYCICTNGDAGGFDPAVARTEIPHIRQREQRAAGEVFGVKERNIHFLGYCDGKLTPSIELRRDISRVIRQCKPQRVVCQSPQRNWEHVAVSHPDHMAAGEAALCGVYPDARNPFAHMELAAEGHEEWTVAETWVMGAERPNHVVDITEMFPKKIAALQAHQSQTAHMDDLENRLGEWAGAIAKQFDLPEGRFAEAFLVINTQ